MAEVYFIKYLELMISFLESSRRIKFSSEQNTQRRRSVRRYGVYFKKFSQSFSLKYV